MSLSFNIAKRYFFSRKSSGAFNLITIISGISLLGYTVGSAALVIVLSAFNGFEELFTNLYSNFDSDIQVTAKEGKVFDTKTLDIPSIRKIDGVWRVSETLEENVLLRYGDQQNLATIKGVDNHYKEITSLDSSIVTGELLLESGDTNFAVVGQGLAYQLGVDPHNPFQWLSIYIPKRGETDIMNPEGSFVRAPIYPVGIFSVQEEVDYKYVLVPLRFLRPLLDRTTELSSLEIKLAPGASPAKVQKAIEQLCGENYLVKNRFEQREAFFQVMQSEKMISYFILFFILLVAASNTIGSLYILVIEKKKDIRMMSSLGMTSRRVAMIFTSESLLIALTGGGIGIIIGIILCYLQQEYGLVALSGSSDFLLSAYPVKMKLADIAIVFATVVFLGVLTALYPAKKASELVL